MTHEFYETLDYLQIMETSIFNQKHTFIYHHSPYGLFMGFDMTLVITMKTITSGKYLFSDHWH